jgi:hypothetical protein
MGACNDKGALHLRLPMQGDDIHRVTLDEAKFDGEPHHT